MDDIQRKKEEIEEKIAELKSKMDVIQQFMASGCSKFSIKKAIEEFKQDIPKIDAMICNLKISRGEIKSFENAFGKTVDEIKLSILNKKIEDKIRKKLFEEIRELQKNSESDAILKIFAKQVWNNTTGLSSSWINLHFGTGERCNATDGKRSADFVAMSLFILARKKFSVALWLLKGSYAYPPKTVEEACDRIFEFGERHFTLYKYESYEFIKRLDKLCKKIPTLLYWYKRIFFPKKFF